MDTEQDFPLRLGQAVVDRRVRLGMRQEDLAAAASLSVGQVRKIEQGRAEDMRPLTIAKLETGLRWEPGSVRLMRSGGEPRVVPDTVVEAEMLTEAIRGLPPEAQAEAQRRIDGLDEVRRLYGYEAALAAMETIVKFVREGRRANTDDSSQ